MKTFDWANPYPSVRIPLFARNVVSTSHPLAAQAGLRMLLKGGNAVDAAIAAAATIVLVEPVSCGLGGDCFAIVWDGKELHGLNSSGVAPAAWNTEYFKRKYGTDANGLAIQPKRGWDAVTVPGVVAGWAALHEKLGKLPFEQLFEPAIEIAERGYAVPPVVAHKWAAAAEELKSQPGYAQAEAADVVALMAPEIEKIKALGITALVECSTGGVGRRADLDLAVSKAVNFPIVVPTGNYREPWIPAWVASATEAELEAWMVRELEQRFDEADYRAGWIKISAGDDGITPLEARILRAAARAGQRTGAIIGSHTIKGRVVMDQLDIIEAEGYRADRFISIHTQAEKDFGLNLAVAERGAWIEYDNIGWVDDSELLPLILKVIEAGRITQLMLSHDMGWYDPAQPGGGTPRPYTHLSQSLLPKLRATGVSDAQIVQLTHTNPFEAYAR